MESETENKHHEKKNLRKDIVFISNKLKIG